MRLNETRQEKTRRLRTRTRKKTKKNLDSVVVQTRQMRRGDVNMPTASLLDVRTVVLVSPTFKEGRESVRDGGNKNRRREQFQQHDKTKEKTNDNEKRDKKGEKEQNKKKHHKKPRCNTQQNAT